MSSSGLLAEAVLSTHSGASLATAREGILRFWNPGSERIFGYAANDVIGRSLDVTIMPIPGRCEPARRRPADE